MSVHRCKTHGFTLLELLTVLGVLSVVTAIGIRAFFAVSDGWKTISIRSALDVRAITIMESLRHDFDQVLSPFRSGVSLKGFEGTTQSSTGNFDSDGVAFPIEYVNPLTGQVERAMVAFELSRQGSPVLERVVHALDAPPTTGNRAIVGEGAMAMRIEFNDGMTWVRGWDDVRLPKAVRVSLVLQDADRPWEQISRTAVFTIFVE